MSRGAKNPSSEFPTRPDANEAVREKKMATLMLDISDVGRRRIELGPSLQRNENMRRYAAGLPRSRPVNLFKHMQ